MFVNIDFGLRVVRGAVVSNYVALVIVAVIIILAIPQVYQWIGEVVAGASRIRIRKKRGEDAWVGRFLDSLNANLAREEQEIELRRQKDAEKNRLAALKIKRSDRGKRC